MQGISTTIASMVPSYKKRGYASSQLDMRRESHTVTNPRTA